jgi:hypothetical protein
VGLAVFSDARLNGYSTSRATLSPKFWWAGTVGTATVGVGTGIGGVDTGLACVVRRFDFFGSASSSERVRRGRFFLATSATIFSGGVDGSGVALADGATGGGASLFATSGAGGSSNGDGAGVTSATAGAVGAGAGAACFDHPKSPNDSANESFNSPE